MSIITDPVLPQAQNSGDIVDVRLSNDTGTAQAAGEITFGQTFADGDMPAGAQLVALINGQQVPVQVDVKSTNADGSVRFAVLTVDAPAIAANSSVDVMLARGTPVTAGQSPVQIGNIVSQGYNTTVDVTLHNTDGSTTPVHLDVGQLLSNALQSGHVTTWMQGPLATEVQFTATISGSLQAEFNVTSYADGKVSTQLVMQSAGSYQSDANTDHTYDIAVHSGGQTVFQQNSLDQVAHTTWQQTFWSSGSSVAAAPAIQPVFDMNYLEKTGALPALDLSLGVNSSTLDSYVTALNSANTGPEGSALITQYMPQTGGRPDIGQLTTWEANYIESQDPRALQVMLANANAAGSVPWHFNDPATAQPVSIVNHPTANIFGAGSGNGVNDLDPSPSNTNGFSVDEAHQPELTYIAYLTTGNPYYLQELQAQANFALLDVNPGYRGNSLGLIDDGHGQLRAAAWDIREMEDAAFISPNTDPLQSYFSTAVNNNLNYLANAYVFGGAMSNAGQLQGWIPDYPAGGIEPGWEDDYLATVLSQGVKQGFTNAAAAADWMINFEAGRFLNATNGFSPFDATVHHLNLWNPGTQGAFSVFDAGATLYSTWAQAYQASLANNDFTSPPDMSGFTQAEYYPMYARGALAELFNATGAIDALAAFGVLTSVMNATPDLQTNPKWDFMPQLHDGNILQATDLNVVTGSTGNTFTNTVHDLLIYDTGSGSDIISGGQGANVLFAGSGTDTVTAGSKGDYLFGGSGADQLIGGAGDDVIVAGSGSSTMTGGGGSDTFVLREGGGNVTITDFRAGDSIRLEHYSAQSFAALQSAMTQSGNDVVIHLDAGQTLTIQNTTVSALTAGEFAFSGPVYPGAAASTLQTSHLAAPGPLSVLQPGTWMDVANSHLLSVAYNGPLAASLTGSSGPSGVMDAWGGGTLDTNNDMLLVWGGGHQAYYGNELYAFSLNTLQWSRLDNPSDISNWNHATTILPDGTPAVPHTYDSLSFIPGKGMLNVALAFSGDAAQSGPQSFIIDPSQLNANSTGVWQPVANSPVGGAGTVSAYDPVTGDVFAASNSTPLYAYSPTNNTWALIGDGNSLLPDYHMTGAVDPVDRLFVAVGGMSNQGPGLVAYSLTTGNIVHTGFTGDTTMPNGNAPGFVWDSAANLFVGWDGGSTLYTLDPHTWQFTAHPAAFGNTVVPTAPNNNGTFGRFQYDAADNLFVVVNSADQDVFIYKPDFGSDTSITGTSGSGSAGGSTPSGGGTSGNPPYGSGGSSSGSGQTYPSGSPYGSGSGYSPNGNGQGYSYSTGYQHELMPDANALMQAFMNEHAGAAAVALPQSSSSASGHAALPLAQTTNESMSAAFESLLASTHATAAHADWVFHL
jgi:hypothetical protein